MKHVEPMCFPCERHGNLWISQWLQQLWMSTLPTNKCVTVKLVARWRWKAWCLDTRGFILMKIQWHIHAGLWSLVNWWCEALTRHYIRCSWILMRVAVGLMEWPRPWWWSVYPHDTPTSPFHRERRGIACMQETITRNIQWSWRDWVMQQIWMYYKEKLTKNLADLNTF